MAYLPIANAVPQYINEATGLPYSGAVLKGYKAGTSTPLKMATDAAGGTLVDDMPLNSAGYSTVSGAVQIPHFNENFKLFLYPTQAAADANNGEIWSTVDMAIEALGWVKGADLASATELLVNVTGNIFDVSGTITVESLETRDGNDLILLHFDDALTLQHHATNLVLPDGQDIKTVSGDIGMFYEYAAGDWRLASWNGDLANTFKIKKGADIASANDLVLLNDGNYNDVTGTTQINGFTAGLVNEIRKFHFDGAVVLKHNTAPSAGFSKLWVTPGAADLTTAANDEFEFTFDGTYWRVGGYVLASGKSIVVQDTTVGTAQATTSGTSFDFTGVPSWVKVIHVTFNAVSLDGNTDHVIVQLGDSDGIETTGYVANDVDMGATVKSSTAGFPLDPQTATLSIIGVLILTLHDSSTNTWIGSGNYSTAGTVFGHVLAGRKNLTGTLDRIRITRSGSTDSFDAGAVNITYF